MNYSQNINLSDPNDYTHIDKPIARNNNVNPVTWVNFIEFSSVDNFGYGNLSGSIGGTWLTVLDTINNLFKDLNDRLTVVENAINNINPNPNPDPQRTLTSIMWSSTTASSQKGAQISYPSITCVYNDGDTSSISATSTGVTLFPIINSSSDAGTYNITATYNGKTTTNTLTYRIESAPSTTYSVTYNANGGNSTPANQTANAGSTITLASSISRNEDANYTYTFAGWNTQSNGGGTNYTAGQQITLNSNLTLYAKWDAHQKQVTQYYFSVGTTTPTASNYITANNATTNIPTIKEFTNNSGSKALVYVLIPASKTISAIDTYARVAINMVNSGIAISNHKLYVTDGKIANGGSLTFTIS